MARPNVIYDDREVRSMLEQLIAKTENLTPALKNIGEYLTTSNKERFERGVDPDGQAWAPLAASTLAAKRDQRILFNKGERDGLFNSIIWQLSGDGQTVIVGTDKPYAAYLHFGTSPYTIRPKNKKALHWPGAAHPVNQVNHPGLKPRPFLGISSADEEEMFAIIAHFLDV